ncbi:MAG: hypothetical protein ACK5AZ_21425 [Bryobacteraceae bacterium]
MWILPFSLPLLTGIVWAHVVLRSAIAVRGPMVWLLTAALGSGLGVGLASIAYFLLLNFGAASPEAVLAVDAILFLAGALMLRRSAATPPAPAPARISAPLALRIGLGLALFITTVITVGSFLEFAGAIPHGNWDGWAIWNLRAKFLAGGAETWQHALSPLNYTRSEYPLLLSGFIARCWLFTSGANPTAVPMAAALLFALATLTLLVAAISLSRCATTGFTAGLILLSSSLFVSETFSQYADIPLAFYFLGALSLIALSSRYDRHRLLLLAGLCASLAAWTKDEGIPFALLCLLGVAAASLPEGVRSFQTRAVAFLAGALPVFALVAWFKLFLAPPTALFFQEGQQSRMERLTDVSRYTQIASSFGGGIADLGEFPYHPLLLLVLAAAGLQLRRSKSDLTERLPLLIAGLMLLAYFGVYVLTPVDLQWHLSTSTKRLLVQLWPPFVLGAFLLLRSATEASE